MKSDHPFQRRVLHYIHQEQLISGKAPILTAVSGGPDSTALLHLLVSLRDACDISRIVVLHFDHQLRGEASAEDRAFVEALANTLGVPFHSGTEEVRSYHRRRRISLEMAARVCRHRFFEDALDRFEAQAVALGHTANDQAEELLLRLFRGTGPGGMSGMASKTPAGLIRPLLFATRSEILAYLHDRKISFREDLSNRDPTHQRNALRHKILPLVEHHFHPQVVRVLCRHARLADDEESCWADQLENQWPAVCVAETSSRIVMRGPALLLLHPALQRRILRLALERLRGDLLGIYAVHIESLCRLLARGTPNRSIRLPGGLLALVDGEFFVLSKESGGASAEAPPVFSQTLPGPGLYRFPGFELRLGLMEAPSWTGPGSFPETPDTIQMDAGAVQWPISLRLWKKGDRFRPLGLGGSKKLQDFFVDCKIPRHERGRVVLLCDREKICWVMGYRLDDRVKVTAQTKEILVIEKSNPA